MQREVFAFDGVWRPRRRCRRLHGARMIGAVFARSRSDEHDRFACLATGCRRLVGVAAAGAGGAGSRDQADRQAGMIMDWCSGGHHLPPVDGGYRYGGRSAAKDRRSSRRALPSMACRCGWCRRWWSQWNVWIFHACAHVRTHLYRTVIDKIRYRVCTYSVRLVYNPKLSRAPNSVRIGHLFTQ